MKISSEWYSDGDVTFLDRLDAVERARLAWQQEPGALAPITGAQTRADGVDEGEARVERVKKMKVCHLLQKQAQN